MQPSRWSTPRKIYFAKQAGDHGGSETGEHLVHRGSAWTVKPEPPVQEQPLVRFIEAAGGGNQEGSFTLPRETVPLRGARVCNRTGSKGAALSNVTGHLKALIQTSSFISFHFKFNSANCTLNQDVSQNILIFFIFIIHCLAIFSNVEGQKEEMLL